MVLFITGGSTCNTSVIVGDTDLFANNLVVTSVVGDERVAGQQTVVSGHRHWQEEARQTEHLQ